MCKKLFAVLLASTLLFASAAAASMEFTVGSTAFKVETENGVEEKVLEVAPYINEASRTMVPVRAIAEAFGIEPVWDGVARTVTLSKEGTEIILTIDKEEALVNGEVKKLDAPPVIVEDRTFVPLRFISEALLCNVQYASLTKQILIDDSEIIMQCGENFFSFAEFETIFNIFYLGNLEYAMSSGMDEISFAQLVAQVSLKTVEEILWFKAAYPNASLSAEEREALLSMLEANAPFSAPLSGYTALIYEKNQIIQGDTVARVIRETKDLPAYYEENYVMAKHILVADEETANAVYEKAVRGEDFDALVKEYGQDPGMEMNPEGYVFTKGEMVEEFEVATYGAAVDEITKPVPSQYGYHIIKRVPLKAYGEDMEDSVVMRIAAEDLEKTEKPVMKIGVEALYEKMGISTKTAE